MKKFVGFVFCLFVLASSIQAQPTPLAYYPAEGDFADASGTGLNGVAIGTVNFAPSIVGQAFSLPLGGGNKVRTAGSIEFLGGNGLTVSAWVKPDAAGSANQTMIARRATGGVAPWRLGRTGRDLFFLFYDQSGGLHQVILSDVIDTDVWTHVTGSWNGTELKVYANGIPATNLLSSGIVMSSSGYRNVWIGAGGSTEPDFEGLIDEVKIFNYGLTDAEVATLATPPNVAPTITVSAPLITDEDVPLSLSGILITDFDNPSVDVTVSVDLGSLSPESTTLTGSSTQVSADLGAITYAPDENFNGEAQLTVSVTDGLLSETQIIPVTINPVNDAPVLDPIGDQVTDEDVQMTIPLSGSDVDGNPLYFRVTNVSDYTKVNAWILGTNLNLSPFNNVTGDVSITVTVMDRSNPAHPKALTDSETFVLTINPVNDGPTIRVDKPLVTDEDVPLSLSGILITDFDNPSVDVTVSANMGSLSPESTMLTGSSTQVSNVSLSSITYTPDENFNGEAQLTVHVTDGSLSETQIIPVTINPVNDAPVLDPIGDQVTDEDVQLTIPLSGSDVDGNPLYFSVTNVSDYTINAWISDTNLMLIPINNVHGQVSITVTVKDRNSPSHPEVVTDSETFVLTINPVDDMPTITAPSTLFTDEDVSLILSGFEIKEADNQNVSVTLGVDFGSLDVESTLLTHAATSVVNSVLSSATYIPDENYNGVATLTVNVTDGSLSASQTTALTIHSVNDAPSFVAGSDQALVEDAGAQIVMGWATNISAGPANEADEELIFDVTNNNASLFVEEPAISAVGDLTYTLADNAHGEAVVTVVLKDTGGRANGGVDVSDPTTFRIEVTAVNDAPVVTASEALMTDEDVPLTLSALSISDIDNASVSVTVGVDIGTLDAESTTLTGAATEVTAALNVMTYIPEANDNGSATLTVDVSDGVLSNTQDFSIAIHSVNDLPVLNTIGDQVTDEATPLSIALSAKDIESNTLTFGARASGSGVNVDVLGNTLNLTPRVYSSGDIPITVTVDDGEGGIDKETFVLTVQGLRLHYSAEGNGNDVTGRFDGQNNGGVVIADGIDGQAFHFDGINDMITSSFKQEGPFTVSLWVQTDNLDQKFLTSVIATSDDLDALGSFQIGFGPPTAGTPRRYLLTVNDQGANRSLVVGNVTTDPQHIAVAYDGTTISTYLDGALQTRAALSSAQFHLLKLGRNRSTGVSRFFEGILDEVRIYNYAVSEAELHALATPPNVAPVLIVPQTQIVDEGERFGFSIEAIEPDPGQVVTLTAENLPQGAHFVNGVFRWAPNFDQAGSYEITIIATDNGEPVLSDVAPLRIVVRDVIQPGKDVTSEMVDESGGTASASIAFDNVEQAGETSFASVPVEDVPKLPTRVRPVSTFDISTRAVSKGDKEVEIEVEVDESLDEKRLRLLHHEEDVKRPNVFWWKDTTLWVKRIQKARTAQRKKWMRIRGRVKRFSPFAIVESLNQVPIISLPETLTTPEDVALHDIGIEVQDADSPTLSVTVSMDPGTVNGEPTSVGLTGTVDELNAFLNTVTVLPSAHFNGVGELTVLVEDGDLRVTQIAAITVTPVNDVPSFMITTMHEVAEDADEQTVANFASAISAGPADEVGQTLQFTLSGDNTDLFAIAPVLSLDGTLIYTPAENAHGTATITATLKDDGGVERGGVDTSVEASFTITITPVNDPPVAVCSQEPISVALDATGEATLDPLIVDGGSSDVDDEVLTFSLDRTVFTCEDLGPQSLTFTVTDDEGASSSCDVQVVVVDTIAPVITEVLEHDTAIEEALVLECTGPEGVIAVLSVMATDNCGSEFTYVWYNGQDEQIGSESSFAKTLAHREDPHILKVAVIDGSGNVSAVRAVLLTVRDTTPPDITLEGIDSPVTVECNLGEYEEPGFFVSDICDIEPTVTVTHDIDMGVLGTYTVTYLATDASGNTTTASRSVEVIDTTAPTIETLSEPISLECMHPEGEAVSLSVTASDACDLELAYRWYDELNNLIGEASSVTATFGLGQHHARVEVTDDSGNMSEGLVTIEVLDTIAPEVTAALDPASKPSKHNDDGEGDDFDGNWYAVNAQARDICDTEPLVTSLINQPLALGDVFEVKYKNHKKKNVIEMKVDKKGVRVTLQGPDEFALQSLLEGAILQGGFAVADGQVLKLNSKQVKASKVVSEPAKEDKKSKKDKDDSGDQRKGDGNDSSTKKAEGNDDGGEDKGSYKYDFDLMLTLVEAKGPGIGVLVSAEDASGNISETVFVLPQKRKASKLALTKPTLAGDDNADALTFGASNYPNPFNPATTIQYTIADVSGVRLVIYNVLGQEVRTLVQAVQTAGRYSVSWNGQDMYGRQVASGIYVYRLMAGQNVMIKKMLLIK